VHLGFEFDRLDGNPGTDDEVIVAVLVLLEVLFEAGGEDVFGFVFCEDPRVDGPAVGERGE